MGVYVTLTITMTNVYNNSKTRIAQNVEKVHFWQLVGATKKDMWNNICLTVKRLTLNDVRMPMYSSYPPRVVCT